MLPKVYNHLLTLITIKNLSKQEAIIIIGILVYLKFFSC